MPSLSFVTAVLALALPFATSVSASSHFSHPRLSRSHARAVSRALPRSGRRLVSRGNEATLKCLTEHTFALCDGSNCTDMGSVAAGTKCVDGAITWDTSSEASTQDSNAASAGVESVPVPVVASVSTTTTTPAAPSASPSTESDATITGGAKAGVQLHVNANNSDGDDDYVCDDDSDDSSAAGTPWADRGQASATGSADSADSADSTPVATPTGAAATADFAAVSPAATSSSSSSAAENVELFVSTTTTTSSAPTTTTTSEAPAQTSAPPSSGGGQVYNGKATYYYQYGVAGSCGVYNSDSTYIVALSYQIVDNGAHCGQKVSIKNTANGKSITATVADTCPSCDASHLDVSEGAFLALGDLSSGVLPIEWSFQ